MRGATFCQEKDKKPIYGILRFIPGFVAPKHFKLGVSD